MLDKFDRTSKPKEHGKPGSLMAEPVKDLDEEKRKINDKQNKEPSDSSSKTELNLVDHSNMK